ncbi:hypothetical protein GF415_04330 [Candidatus Micrarchaeota archaeon]|nr:hypothetical protein [Candidatus Micrarchaeota archaeon]
MSGPSLPMQVLPLLQAGEVSWLGQEVSQNPMVTSLLPIALLTAAFIITLYYLIGKALSSPQVNAFATEEFSQLLVSVFIAVAWFAVYGALAGATSLAICYPDYCDHFDIAFYSLDMLFYKLISTYIGYTTIEIFVGLVSSLGFSVPLKSPVLAVKFLSFSPYSGMGMLSNSIVGILESLGMFIGLVVGRKQLLTFFYEITPMFLLPFGLFLRSLPFTRKTGSSIIAIAFAGFFIFPASIILSHYMMFGTSGHLAYIPMAPTPTGLCTAPENPEDEAAALAYLNQSNTEVREHLAEDLSASASYEGNWYQFSGLANAIYSWIAEALDESWGVVSEKFSFYSLFDLLKPTTFAYFFYFLILEHLQAFAQVAVMTIVTFVIEIIITVTGYRAIAAALGGELEILGLTKVV